MVQPIPVVVAAAELLTLLKVELVVLV